MTEPLSSEMIVRGALEGYRSRIAELEDFQRNYDHATKIEREETAKELADLRAGLTALDVAPISGIFFAVVIYFLVAGQFLMGELFPAMVTAQPE